MSTNGKILEGLRERRNIPEGTSWNNIQSSVIDSFNKVLRSMTRKSDGRTFEKYIKTSIEMWGRGAGASIADSIDKNPDSGRVTVRAVGNIVEGDFLKAVKQSFEDLGYKSSVVSKGVAVKASSGDSKRGASSAMRDIIFSYTR